MASSLGLTGTIKQDPFAALYDNLNPVTRERLTVRTREKRTVGYDLNFNPPKSVSVLHLLTGDDQVLKALERAADETMLEIESHAATRVRVGGRDEDRKTGSLAWARFTHHTTRPIDGEPDPQLHVHCFVFNVTHDPAEARFKAGQFRDIKARAPVYEACFHNRLAKHLMALGYRVVPRGWSFEIDGIPEELNAKFSRRTEAIDKAAEELGITDPKRKAKLGAQTRERKTAAEEEDELRERFLARLTPEERALGAALRPSMSPRREPPPDLHERCVTYAVRKCFERESVVTETQFLQTAMRHGIGHVEPEKLMELIAAHPELIHRENDGRQVVTTRTVLAEERAVVDWVRQGHGTMAPLATAAVFGPELAPDLRQAAMHVLTSTDRVTGIAGKAGTGKTTLMRETIAAMQREGHKVIVLGPTADTSRGILRDEGFEQADTVHKLLWSPSVHEDARGAVWWVDEAGLMSMGDMRDLVRLAQELDARLVVSGDTGQHRSVQRGDALRILRDHGALKLASLTNIRRQKGAYKELVEHFSQGEMLLGLKKMEEMGALIEKAGPERYQYLASEYLKTVRAGKTALIVSPTHFEGRQVTELVRGELKAEGKITDERTFDILRKIDMHQVDQEDPRTYRKGWVLDVYKHMPGFSAGRQYEVVEVNDDGVFVRHYTGATRRLDVRQYGDRFRVYERAQVAVGIGDRIRITRNGKEALGVSPVNNGSLHTVKGFTRDGDFILEKGKTLSRRYQFLDHGYVTTSYAAQGKTVDKVFIVESAVSFPAASRQQLYVSASRGKEGLVLVTDEKEGLYQAVQSSSDRTAAMDIAADWREELEMARSSAETPPSTLPLADVKAWLGFSPSARFVQVRSVDPNRPTPPTTPHSLYGPDV